MASSTSFTLPISAIITPKSYHHRLPCSSFWAPFLNFKALFPPKPSLHFLSISKPFLCLSNPQNFDEDDFEEGLIEDLKVPDHWLVPSKALQESEWLRVTLHNWLDNEYCPETTNVQISNVAARSYYESLVAKQGDVGEILLKMARDLESISYQESFHGAFSSANAAVQLIASRIDQE